MKTKVIYLTLIILITFTITSCTEKKTIDRSTNEIENTSGTDEKECETLRLSLRAVHYDTEYEVDDEKSKKLRDMWLTDLNDENKEKVKDLVFSVHSYLESKLVYSFGYDESYPDSPVWNEIDDDPNDNVVAGYTGVEMIEDLTTAKEIINKESFSKIADDIIGQLEYVIEKHDIDVLYEIHQKVHDLSYWAINYPLPSFQIAPADWHGVYVYFGTLY